MTYHTFGLPEIYSLSNKNFIENINKSDVFQDKKIKTILLDFPAKYIY
jgi:hypothetical protein